MPIAVEVPNLVVVESNLAAVEVPNLVAVESNLVAVVVPNLVVGEVEVVVVEAKVLHPTLPHNSGRI